MQTKRGRFSAGLTALLALMLVAELAFGQDGKVTLAQIKQQHPDFLNWARVMLGIGTDQPMAAEVQIMLLSGLLIVPLCQYASFWMKWGAKVLPRETSAIDYLFRQDPQRTVGAYLGALATIGAGCMTDAFSTDIGDFVGWWPVLYNVILVGTGGDAIINKGRGNLNVAAARA